MARTSDHGADRRLAELSERIGYKFRDDDLLREALTHPSALEGRPGPTFERLEFLGDRVLGLIIAETLFKRFPSDREGALAKRYNALVNRWACARAARRAQMGEAIILSPSEREAGGADRDAILADACEALIGALHLDGGRPAAERFIVQFWSDELSQEERPPIDPKTALQEWAAARKRNGPRYEVMSREGPDHDPRFVVAAHVQGLKSVRAEGSSKREAEREAALMLLREAGFDV